MDYKNLISFGIGVIIGAGIGVFATKKFYKDRADEEIKEIRDIYAEKLGRRDKKTETYDNKNENEELTRNEINRPKVFVDKPSLKEMIRAVESDKRDYNEISKEYRSSDNDRAEDNASAYVISPDEFGEMKGYDTKLLTYYADDVLVDDDTEEVIENIEGTISVASLDHIGDYEDGIVHVRNDIFACDYEISMDNRNWKDLSEGPIEE